MPARGHPVYWTEKRLAALNKLARVAEQKPVKGKLDWDRASEKMPALRKILKERTNVQLSKAYSRYKRTQEGWCFTMGCNNKRDTVALNCKSCRNRMKKYSNDYRTRWNYTFFLKKHRKLVMEQIEKKSKKDLADFLVNNIGEGKAPYKGFQERRP